MHARECIDYVLAHGFKSAKEETGERGKMIAFYFYNLQEARDI